MLDIARLAQPHLFEGEYELFEKALASSDRYLEFGLGGSTLMAARDSRRIVVGVDSDPAWARLVRHHPEIAPRVTDGSVAILNADIGPVGEWGSPTDRTELHRWPNYIAAGWAEWARREQYPDLVFIDGRFRVACCLSVVLATGAGAFVEPPRVLIHDMNDERPQYKTVLDFYDVEESVGSLFALTMRTNVDPMAVLARLLRSQFDYG